MFLTVFDPVYYGLVIGAALAYMYRDEIKEFFEGAQMHHPVHANPPPYVKRPTRKRRSVKSLEDSSSEEDECCTPTASECDLSDYS